MSVRTCEFKSHLGHFLTDYLNKGNIMSDTLAMFLFVSIISLLLYILAYSLLVPIIGLKGMFGLLVFCMAYKLSTNGKI